MALNLLILLYRASLRLFPRHFRLEFGEEMQFVFAQAASEAAASGPLALAKTILGEFVHLPIEALRQRLEVSWPHALQAGAHTASWEGPPSRKEMLVALALFVFPAVYILLNTAPSYSTNLLGALMGAMFLVVFLAGMLKGFPRWSLPYLGLALSLVSFVFVFQWTADLAAPSFLSRLGLAPRSESARLVLQAFWAGLLWLSLFSLTFLFIWFLALLRRFHSLLYRIRQDWTLASYILYCGATFTLFLVFDQYRGERPFALASALCLASGAWLYLYSPRRWQRILALLSGLSLAMLAAIAARWSLAPVQDWRAWLLCLPPYALRWPKVHWTIFDWGWVLLIILAPALLKFIPRSDEPTPLGP